MAEHISGDEETFSVYMNQLAENLGMVNTSYANSTGLPNDNLFTTARDISLLARSLIKKFPDGESRRQWIVETTKQGTEESKNQGHKESRNQGNSESRKYRIKASRNQRITEPIAQQINNQETNNRHMDMRYSFLLC